MIVDAVVIASTSHMDDDKELRDDSEDDSSTGESEYNGNDDIDIEEDQEYDKNQQTILFWSSKHTPTIISEMFGGVLLWIIFQMYW